MHKRTGIPDLLAYPLAEAVRITESWGLTPSLQHTSPPKKINQGSERVVRVRLTQDKTVLELTVAAEDCGPLV
ncbi:MAG TPA: hypothetical protein VFC74_00555 [Oscillospiraceae bacterium]|nr:hypothetical protein [Oscillospiraceae bacterium]